MNTFVHGAMAGITTVIGFIWLAPVAFAMVPPEPGPTSQSVATSASTSGLALWQAIAIALVAVAIGAVGASIAQRIHRREAHSQLAA